MGVMGVMTLSEGYRFEPSMAIPLANDGTPGTTSARAHTTLYRTPLFGRYILVESSNDDGAPESVRELSREEAAEYWKALPQHPASYEQAFPAGDADGWHRLTVTMPPGRASAAAKCGPDVAAEGPPELRMVLPESPGLKEPGDIQPVVDPGDVPEEAATVASDDDPARGLSTEADSNAAGGGRKSRAPGRAPRSGNSELAESGASSTTRKERAAEALWLHEYGEWHVEGVVRHDGGYLRLEDDVLVIVTERTVGRIRRRRVPHQESWPLAAVRRVDAGGGAQPTVVIHLAGEGESRTIKTRHCRPAVEVSRLLEALRRNGGGPGTT